MNMSIIDGVGDEVLHFFIAVIIIVLVSIAWTSTDIRNHINFNRTFYLIEHRSRNRVLSNHMESVTISQGHDSVNNSSSEEVERTENVLTASEADGEEGEIIERMDADIEEEVRVRRLTFYEQEGIPVISQETSEIEETMDTSGVNIDGLNTPILNEADKIIIKLKYINDDLKVVEGYLTELLGEFKRKHFETELLDNKRVRLIFNGQVLQRDQDTLRSCGMFNNCVVHCLVHQQQQQTQTDSNRSIRTNGNNTRNNLREWDLGSMLIGTVSFSLASAWYFRYYYPQLFTITATVGLIVITGIFSVISFGLYFPDIPFRAEERVRID